MYVELHAASAFSFLDGASVPEEMAEVCAGVGMPAMALLDRDGVYGSARFHLAMTKAGLKAHIGSEITFALCNPSHRVIGRSGDRMIEKQITRSSDHRILQLPAHPLPL